MPELPEVQCVVNSIKDKIENKKIKKIVRFSKNLREPLSNDLFKLENSTVKKIIRRGKYIIITLESNKDFYLIVHLGMTGSLLFKEKNQKKEKHDHLKIEFENFDLIYNDIRKFGFVIIDDSLKDNKYIKKLGVDPLKNSFENGEFLFKSSRDKNRDVKVFLLDQSIVAGIGNIYIMEALFLTKLNPKIKVKDLTFIECVNLSKTLVFLLEESIKLGGSSISDYKDADNKKGSFQDKFLIYGKKTCSICLSEVEKIKQNGRSTYFCPVCQKL